VRTTQKDEITTQKANEELISTTQKEEDTTQKSKITTQKPLNATQNSDITEDGVKFNIGLLQQYGRLKRKGGRKNGEWVVVEIDG